MMATYWWEQIGSSIDVLRAAVLVPAGPGVDPCLLPQRALLGHDGWHGLGPDSPPGLTLTLPALSGIVWNVCRVLWLCVVPGGPCALSTTPPTASPHPSPGYGHGKMR
jgi:hypothetical protein